MCGRPSLSPGALMPLVREMAARGEATLASSADREVREAAYVDLIADADRARRVVALQFASPTIVEVQGERVPFPVTGAIFARYREIWNAFSPVSLPLPTAEVMGHVHVTDFKISCAAALRDRGRRGGSAWRWRRGGPSRRSPSSTRSSISRFIAAPAFTPMKA